MVNEHYENVRWKKAASLRKILKKKWYLQEKLKKNPILISVKITLKQYLNQFF